jgi:hypothetical protein
VATRAQALIAPHVAADPRKLDAFEAASVTLQPFAEKRRAYLVK